MEIRSGFLNLGFLGELILNTLRHPLNVENKFFSVDFKLYSLSTKLGEVKKVK